MNTQPINGGCYCGAMRYRIAGPLHVSIICHCADCRRVVGAQSVACLVFAFEDFAWESGEPAKFTSSPGVERTFCPTCGTSLTYVSEGQPGEIDVATATLDDPEAFPPTEHVFSEQKLSWES